MYFEKKLDYLTNFPQTQKSNETNEAKWGYTPPVTLNLPLVSNSWKGSVGGIYTLPLHDSCVRDSKRVMTCARSIIWQQYETSVHFSRMRTARWLTISQHVLSRGVSTQGGVCPGGLPRGGGVCTGECLQGGCLANTPQTRGTHPPVDRMTDTCKNITLPQLCCGR